MDNNPSLTTQRLRLRLFTLADAPAVQKLCSEKEIAYNTANIPHPYEKEMAEEAHARDTPMSFLTRRFTSSRDVASTTHAAYCLGSFLDATMMVLADCSGG